MDIVFGLHLKQHYAAAYSYVMIIMCILLWSCIHNGESSDNMVVHRQYCPYFQNRAPSPQPSLDNCTWYKDSACCLNEELSLVFANLLPMAGANSECLEALNHLYCYVCSPNQSNFFNMDTLTVCEESCDVVHSKCNDALLKGVHFHDLYTNGTEFCVARKFLTAKAKTGECFDFTSFFTKSSANANIRSSTTLFVISWFVYMRITVYV